MRRMRLRLWEEYVSEQNRSLWPVTEVLRCRTIATAAWPGWGRCSVFRRSVAFPAAIVKDIYVVGEGAQKHVLADWPREDVEAVRRADHREPPGRGRHQRGGLPRRYGDL
jgi:hypothetical protein